MFSLQPQFFRQIAARQIAALALALTAIAAVPGRAIAQGFEFVPPGDPAPRRSAGGASRIGSQCLDETDTAPLSVLAPDTAVGLTQQARPTLMVYVPDNAAEKAFFSIKDAEDGTLLYQREIALPSEAAIARIVLPEDAPALERDRVYQWYFVAICPGGLEPDSPSASGWIRRADGTGVEASDLEVLASLAANGVWYDALAGLATLRDRGGDPSVEAAWDRLLSSVGLGDLASAPVTAIDP